MAASVPPNTRATLRYGFASTDGYADEQLLEVVLNPDYVVLNAGNLHVSLNSRGNLAYDDAYSRLGEGVTYQQGQPLLAEGGLLVGTSATRVADRLHNDQLNGSQWRFDDDFQSLTQASLRAQPVRAKQEAEANFQNLRPNPEVGTTAVGVRVRQRALAWAEVPHRDYVVLEYQLTNITPDTLKPLYAGLYLDWDLPPASSQNVAEWDEAGGFGYVRALDALSPHTGVKHLAGGTPTYYAIDHQLSSTAVTMSNGFSTAEKFATLSSGSTQRTAGPKTGSDVSQVVGASLRPLAPGDSVTVAFALLGGNSLPALQAAATAAQARYPKASVLLTRPALPTAAWQVYPNPTTGRLRVEVPSSFGAQMLLVRNALGQVVLSRLLASAAASTDVDLAAWPAGLYVVQVGGVGGNLQRRIVVQH